MQEPSTPSAQQTLVQIAANAGFTTFLQNAGKDSKLLNVLLKGVRVILIC